MSINDNTSHIWKHLRNVPGCPSSQWEVWRQQCCELEADATEVLIRALREGPADTHYGAVLALRIFGYEVWGDGYGSDTTYKIKSTTEEEFATVTPRYPPDDDDGVTITGTKPK